MGNLRTTRIRLRFFHKIAVAMIIVAIVPLVIALLVTNSILNKQEADAARDRLKAINEALVSDVARTTEGMERLIGSLARTFPISQRDALPEAVEDQLEDFQI